MEYLFSSYPTYLPFSASHATSASMDHPEHAPGAVSSLPGPDQWLFIYIGGRYRVSRCRVSRYRVTWPDPTTKSC